MTLSYASIGSAISRWFLDASDRSPTAKGTGSAGVTLPAARNGAYCLQATAGDYSYGYFGIW